MKVIVLLNGWGMSDESWGDLPNLLESDCVIFRPEINYLDSLDAICKKLETTIPENSILLGWSLGGMLAIYLAAQYPYKIRSLITLSTNARFVADSDWPTALPQTLFDGFQRLVGDSTEKSLPYFRKLVVKNDCYAQEQRNFLSVCNDEINFSQQQLITGLNLLHSINNRDKYQTINCPALHVFGENDVLVPVSSSRAIQQLNLQHKVVSIENAGHCLHYPAQRVFPVVSNFLQQLPVDDQANSRKTINDLG